MVGGTSAGAESGEAAGGDSSCSGPRQVMSEEFHERGIEAQRCCQTLDGWNVDGGGGSPALLLFIRFPDVLCTRTMVGCTAGPFVLALSPPDASR